jgi:hypothetical protein
VEVSVCSHGALSDLPFQLHDDLQGSGTAIAIYTMTAAVHGKFVRDGPRFRRYPVQDLSRSVQIGQLAGELARRSVTIRGNNSMVRTNPRLLDHPMFRGIASARALSEHNICGFRCCQLASTRSYLVMQKMKRLKLLRTVLR